MESDRAERAQKKKFPVPSPSQITNSFGPNPYTALSPFRALLSFLWPKEAPPARFPPSQVDLTHCAPLPPLSDLASVLALPAFSLPGPFPPSCASGCFPVPSASLSPGFLLNLNSQELMVTHNNEASENRSFELERRQPLHI